MREGDVRAAFLLETGFLALGSALAGVLLALTLMAVLSRITFEMSDNPLAMFLVHGRLYFLPSLAGVLGYIALIVLIAVGTAYFPSKRAAALSPAQALRHFD